MLKLLICQLAGMAKCWIGLSPRGVFIKETLFPPIFIMLCVERLGHLIYDAVNSSRWKHSQFSHNSPLLSHLFFADDLVMFAKASVDQIKVVMDCLHQFCIVSSQKVSFWKSSIFVSRDMDLNVNNEIS